MNTPRVSLGPRWQRFWKISEKRFIEINGDVDDHWSSFCRSCDPSLWPPESCSIPTPRLQYNCLWYGTSIFLSFDSIHFDHPEFAVVTVSASSIIWLGSVAERHTAAFLAYRPPLTCSPTATSTLLFSFSFLSPAFSFFLPDRPFSGRQPSRDQPPFTGSITPYLLQWPRSVQTALITETGITGSSSSPPL